MEIDWKDLAEQKKIEKAKAFLTEKGIKIEDV